MTTTMNPPTTGPAVLVDLASEPHATTRSQRWQRGAGSWRDRDDVADTSRLDVVEISEAVAKAFVVEHHYSRSYPASRQRYGLVDTREDRLLGVCVLGVPMQDKVLTNVFPDLPTSRAAELSRLVLLDDPVAGANAESWMVSRVFKNAAAQGLRGIVAFSDPVPRRRSDGTTVLPGHVGFIYQALGAQFLGRSTQRSLLMLPDATVLSARAMSKVRARERGHEYVERQLVGLGARPLGTNEEPRLWLAEALEMIGARSFRHPGNYRYAWAVGTRAERRGVHIAGESAPYPKSIDLAA